MRRATVHYDNYNLHCVISIHALLAESDLTIMLYDTSSLLFLSTLSLRRATLVVQLGCKSFLFLSTLSLRRATSITITITCIVSFLSTLSLRRATLAGPSGPAFLYNFYPRSPCGERPNWFDLWGWAEYFYPRSPCGERLMDTLILTNAMLFLSTLSLRRATARRASRQQPAGISIHALLAESDGQNISLLDIS